MYIFSLYQFHCFTHLPGSCSRVLLTDFLMSNPSSRWAKFGAGWSRDFSKAWSKNCLVEFLMNPISVESSTYISKTRLRKIISFSTVKLSYSNCCYVYIVHALYENKSIFCTICMKMNPTFTKPQTPTLLHIYN